LLLLERRSAGKKASGRPRRTWIEDPLQWAQKHKYHEVKKLAENTDTPRGETEDREHE